MSSKDVNKSEEISRESRGNFFSSSAIVYSIRIKSFKSPIKISYLSFNVEKLREIFYFHEVEKKVAKVVQRVSMFVQFLQRSLEKSLLLSSLWSGVILTIAFLLMVIVLGAH